MTAGSYNKDDPVDSPNNPDEHDEHNEHEEPDEHDTSEEEHEEPDNNNTDEHEEHNEHVSNNADQDNIDYEYDDDNECIVAVAPASEPTPGEPNVPELEDCLITVLDSSTGVDRICYCSDCWNATCEHCENCSVENCPVCDNCQFCATKHNEFKNKIANQVKKECDYWAELIKQGYPLDGSDEIIYERNKLIYKSQIDRLNPEESRRLKELNNLHGELRPPNDDRGVVDLPQECILTYNQLREMKPYEVIATSYIIQTFVNVKFLLTFGFTDEDLEDREKTQLLYDTMIQMLIRMRIPYQEYRSTEQDSVEQKETGPSPDNISVTLQINNPYKVTDDTFVDLMTRIYDKFIDETDVRLGCCPHETSQDLCDRLTSLGYILNTCQIEQYEDELEYSQYHSSNCNKDCLLHTVKLTQ